MTLEIHIMPWDRRKNVAELNCLTDQNSSLPNNWISRDNTNMKKTY